ncbi:MAG: glycosyltransferase family 2 protein [Chloroflexota bacterium]|nr:glycosyltransferase family 2 protein [Chloroflexota bacterium]
MIEARQDPFLSIVIPAYNEEKRLPPALERVATFLRAQSYSAEVLIVENGSTDQTSSVVEAFAAEQVKSDDPFVVRLLHSEKGKGNAVRHGAMSARGEFVLVSDTDLAVPIEETIRFLPPAVEREGYGIAIASREIPGAVRHGEPEYRHVMGRVFNLLVRWMAVPKIQDTQCGFKCLSREAAHTVFPLQRIDGWGFDVEVLYIAQRHGIPIVEIPVNWYYGQDSRVRPVQDTINMLRDLLAIRRNSRAGLYDRALGAGGEELSAV